MKSQIKILSEAISEVLEQNSITNEMDALFDYGEWSQSGPDFSNLIKNFSLTREKLSSYIDEAKYYADKFFECSPRLVKWDYRKGDPMYNNPWYCIYENLNCIFMAGYLIEEKVSRTNSSLRNLR